MVQGSQTPKSTGRTIAPPAFRVSSLAVLTAVTVVFTFMVKIPVAPTKGYVHLGDVAIMFTAFTFGPVTAMISGALGTGIADLLAGYPQWAPISFFIHGIQGFLAGAIMRSAFLKTSPMKDDAAERRAVLQFPIARALAAGAAGLVVLVGFYFLAGAAMVGFGAALVEIPGNILQGSVGTIGGILLAKAVYRAYPPVRGFFW